MSEKDSFDLEDSEQWLVERVEVLTWFLLRFVIAELSTEQLHAEQSKDDDEEKQQQQQAGDWPHAVDERCHQITKRRPVSILTANDQRRFCV